MTSIMKNGNGSVAKNSLPQFDGLLDQFFHNNLNRILDDRFWGSEQAVNSRVPVNVKDTDKTIELELIAPGLRKEDLKLQVTNDMLTIAFDHREEKEEGKEGSGYLRREYRQQSFSRSFSLNNGIDTGNISAQYQDGVLHVTLPKKEEAQRFSRTIEIR